MNGDEREPSGQTDSAPAAHEERAPGTLPDEPLETKLARQRSQRILLFSVVLFFLGVAGLEGLEMVKIREENRRKRRERAFAAELASAAASGSSRPPPPFVPLPAWTPSRRP